MLEKMLPRKLIAASFTTSVYTILLALMLPNPLGKPIQTNDDYLSNFFLSICVYFFYVFISVFLYGVIASLVTEYIVEKGKLRPPLLFLTLGHLAFGLPLWIVSLIPGLLFLIFDQSVKRRNHRHDSKLITISFILPTCVFLFGFFMFRYAFTAS
ncbi:hypothetical protein ACI7RC_05085 [Brevibacillus sp. B_LB10_24]|uniref:hypothetical protein n=1 Tax=Brevibacillus sp. B_LB10_24 TaxID=3380645 RepID=UPI0038BAB3EB